MSTSTQIHLIDSHVHLWPQHMSNPNSHSWMSPGHMLSQPHLLSDYDDASSAGARRDSRNNDDSDPSSHQEDFVVDGIVYVETDVRYDAPPAKLRCIDEVETSQEALKAEVRSWAVQPIEEVKFLRSVIETARGAKMLRGLVLWAPMSQHPRVLDAWLSVVEEISGKDMWPRVKGFRFLLQGYTDQAEFEAIVNGENFAQNLRELGRRGFSFDITVDTNSVGVWQMEMAVKAFRRALQGVEDEERPVCVLNHLCKPHFDVDGAEFRRWCTALQELSRLPRTYMKLSGAFSELPDEMDISAVGLAKYMKPWLDQTVRLFGPERILFGSDWPVCNVKGRGAERPWRLWAEVVSRVLDGSAYALSQEDKQRVWSGSAAEAYRL